MSSVSRSGLVLTPTPVELFVYRLDKVDVLAQFGDAVLELQTRDGLWQPYGGILCPRSVNVSRAGLQATFPDCHRLRLSRAAGSTACTVLVQAYGDAG